MFKKKNILILIFSIAILILLQPAWAAYMYGAQIICDPNMAQDETGQALATGNKVDVVILMDNYIEDGPDLANKGFAGNDYLSPPINATIGKSINQPGAFKLDIQPDVIGTLPQPINTSVPVYYIVRIWDKTNRSADAKFGESIAYVAKHDPKNPPNPKEAVATISAPQARFKTIFSQNAPTEGVSDLSVGTGTYTTKISLPLNWKAPLGARWYVIKEYGIIDKTTQKDSPRTGTNSPTWHENTHHYLSLKGESVSTDLIFEEKDDDNRAYVKIAPANGWGEGPTIRFDFDIPKRPDLSIPSPITDLKIKNLKSTQAELEWTAPTDIDQYGKQQNVDGYEIIYAIFPKKGTLFTQDFVDVQQKTKGAEAKNIQPDFIAKIPPPIEHGKLQTLTLDNLKEETYLISIRSYDKGGPTHASILSNIVTIPLGKGSSGAVAYDLDITTPDLGKTVVLTWKSSVTECELQTATDLEFKNIVDRKSVKEKQVGSYEETLEGIKDIDKTPVKFFRVIPLAGTAAPFTVVGAVAIKLDQVNAISFPFHTVKGITDATDPVEALKNSIDKQAKENQSKSRVTSIGIFEGGQHKGWVAADKTSVGKKPSIVGLGTPIQITLGNSEGAVETVPFIMVGKR